MLAKDLPFPKKVHEVRDYTLPEKLYLDQWIIPTGITVTLKISTNFGWVILPEDCRDVRGFVVQKRIFKV